MMRGSASTQVSIDSSERAGFCKKIPACPDVIPGAGTADREHSGHRRDSCKKTYSTDRNLESCGQETMRNRSVSMSEEFSFYTYAEYVYHVPLIFARDHGNIMLTGEWSAAEYYRGRLMTEERSSICCRWYFRMCG